MIYDWKMEVYWRLPVFLQEMALSAYAYQLERIYYGPGYKEWCQRYKCMQNWSRSEADEWQNCKLQTILEVAGRQVPYYKEKWGNLNWKSIDSVQKLPILPRVEKQYIRQNEKSFLADGLNSGSLWVEKTSGSTGTSLRIYWPMAMVPKWWAIVEVMVREPVGLAQSIPRAMMGGRPVLRGNNTKSRYWRYNRWWRQLYFSSYHVSKTTAPHYINALRVYGSEWITGYGSAIAALADSALEAGLAPLSLRAAIVSGDTLLPGMRAAIEKFFTCKCFDHYGQSEGVCMAMECKLGRMHVVPWVGILEILREDGSPCEPGEVGEIVGTTLLNTAMPLIRYRLGDYAAWDTNQACLCGNPHPIITKLEGRVDDYLVTADGRKIGRLSTAVKRSQTIHSAQIIQDRPGHAYLLVRPGEGYCFDDASAVRDDIIERIGRFHLEIKEVPEIPKTPQGKTSLVVRLSDRPEMKMIYEELLQIAINN